MTEFLHNELPLDQDLVNMLFARGSDALYELEERLAHERSHGCVILVRRPRDPGYVALMAAPDAHLAVAIAYHWSPFGSDDFQFDAVWAVKDRRIAFEHLREQLGAMASERTNHHPGACEWFKLGRAESLSVMPK